MINNNYVLLTAAYNEEKFIIKTIESVVNQTILPQRWVIVSDGSTDRTDDIVKDYAERYHFIQFVRREKVTGRDFSAKVLALQKGFQLLADVNYSFYCTLDADVSFQPDYFKIILTKFCENPKLGIAGGIRLNYCNDKFRKEIVSLSNVVGSVQFFRRECFESAGGFVPSKIGGEDTILEIRAKKNGWIVQSFQELQIYHYRRTGSAEGFLLKSRYRDGIADYCLGNPIFFEFFKCCRRLTQRPYLIGSVMTFCGFTVSFFKKPEKFLSNDEIEFVKRYQLKKIKNWVYQRLRFLSRCMGSHRICSFE